MGAIRGTIWAMNDKRCYELRIYTAGEGKLDALNARFRNHTLGLFKKHGMTSVGYWTPLANPERKLYYVLAYPNREFRNAAFKAFGADPEWQAVYKESEKDGKLATKVESQFLHTLDFSPKLPAKSTPLKQPRAFELRTYYASPGNLARLQNRFRQHTTRLFEKHKMTNIAYWELDPDQKGADNTLVYLMAYPNEAARKASWDSFRTDPAWLVAREASEKDAGGALTLKDGGVVSLLLTPTDYSPLV